MKFYLKYEKQGSQFQFKAFLLSFRDSFFLITYYLVVLILLLSDQYYEKSSIFYIIDLVASYFMYVKARRLFYHFKIDSYTTPFKYYFKILDLVWNIIALEHIFVQFIQPRPCLFMRSPYRIKKQPGCRDTDIQMLGIYKDITTLSTLQARPYSQLDMEISYPPTTWKQAVYWSCRCLVMRIL